MKVSAISLDLLVRLDVPTGCYCQAEPAVRPLRRERELDLGECEANGLGRALVTVAAVLIAADQNILERQLHELDPRAVAPGLPTEEFCLLDVHAARAREHQLRGRL